MLVETLPQQYRSHNGNPDYQRALQYATDMDVSRGSALYNSWWDRVRINCSCYQSAIELSRILPLLNQLLPRPSDTDVQQINDRVNETLIVAKEGHDKLGQSHLREGRQKFMAVEKLQAVDDILKRAGSSIQVLKKKQETMVG